jgi:hypothetical protein
MKRIEICNNSALRAKFRVLPQNEESKVLASYDVDMSNGIIEPTATAGIMVTLTTS